ncbi:Phytoene dehydrogenase-like protein OS=Streptomyces albaduncus OX=68172 GN=FHS32_004002 PE=4 SV=1 [Streptomyces griseoloalbus]
MDRGDGVYLAGDRVAAPGVLSEVSFTSALTAVSLALGRDALDLKRA